MNLKSNFVIAAILIRAKKVILIKEQIKYEKKFNMDIILKIISYLFMISGLMIIIYSIIIGYHLTADKFLIKNIPLWLLSAGLCISGYALKIIL